MCFKLSVSISYSCSLKNKEAEAKEELKRRAKQLEMQRREQQRRAAAGGGGGSSGGFGGIGSNNSMGSYSPVPRFEMPSPQPQRTSSPAPASVRAPAFKGSGMKLGSKKAKNAELLDALGGEAIPPPELSAPATPAAPLTPEPSAKAQLANLPEVHKETYVFILLTNIQALKNLSSIHAVVREQLSAEILREGGLKSMTLKGEMLLQVSDAAEGKIKLLLAPFESELASELQFKQHPNVAKFGPSGDRVIALKDPSRSFPVNMSLGVLKWRYDGKDETYIPLASESVAFSSLHRY